MKVLNFLDEKGLYADLTYNSPCIDVRSKSSRVVFFKLKGDELIGLDNDSTIKLIEDKLRNVSS